MVHSIGDRAIRTQLDIFARVESENGPRDRRFRIEHAQHIAPPEIARFGRLGVIASMQPYHAIDDGRWAETVIGAERAKGTYAFRSLLDGAAYAGFQDSLVGVLKPGMLADFVMLDRDITTVAPETIAAARVRLTAVGGRVVFERK